VQIRWLEGVLLPSKQSEEPPAEAYVLLHVCDRRNRKTKLWTEYAKAAEEIARTDGRIFSKLPFVRLAKYYAERQSADLRDYIDMCDAVSVMLSSVMADKYCTTLDMKALIDLRTLMRRAI